MIDDFVVTHVRVETARAFAEVRRDLESQLGRFDPAVSESLASGSVDGEAVRGRIEAMAGPSGLMSFGTIDHGAVLSLLGMTRRAVQYIVGNPLVAIEMTRHALGAGLYAPLRVLISEDEAGRTCVNWTAILAVRASRRRTDHPGRPHAGQKAERSHCFGDGSRGRRWGSARPPRTSPPGGAARPLTSN